MAPVGLPPGFRFHPTDEELVNYYLHRKISGQQIELDIIPEVNLYRYEPWQLGEKSILLSRDPEWYFFGSRDRKYPNGVRTNRATGAGYWKSTGRDKRVTNQQQQHRVTGMKKTLVYYEGRAPQGIRTNWVMHEYRLVNTPGFQQDCYALYRLFMKKGICSKMEEQRKCTSLTKSSRSVTDETETMAADVPWASSSCKDDEDKDESWMQFISNDPWCYSNDAMGGGEEVSDFTLTT